jgi:hypothetical protein
MGGKGFDEFSTPHGVPLIVAAKEHFDELVNFGE